MNREQIIKALDYCTSGGTCLLCTEDEKTPLLNKTGCMAVQMQNALTLIKELTEENERLKHTISQLGKNNDELARVLPLAKKEVEVETRADTVREMQSEIKDRCLKGGIYPAFVARTIDQIAKEMLEENK